MQEKVLLTDYQPGRTLEELERQPIQERLNYTHTEVFHILMSLISL
jgi:hypothetical protein